MYALQTRQIHSNGIVNKWFIIVTCAYGIRTFSKGIEYLVRD